MDHHLCSFELSLKKSKSLSFYWHFNIKRLHDVKFCESFILLWNKWKGKKNDYENNVQWWEVGKPQIRMFCQNYTAHTNSLIKRQLENLREILNNLK